MELKRLLRANLDRVLALGSVLIGLIAIILGWVGISGTGLVAEQNPYLISGGVLGIALIGIGCTAWVSADLQDEWRRLDRLQEHLEALAAREDDPAPPSALPRPSAAARRTRPLAAKSS